MGANPAPATYSRIYDEIQPITSDDGKSPKN